ncbi:MAG: glutaredoxin family protein [Acidiferrobacteraceae bacterium]
MKRLVLYGRSGCHLCEDMRRDVEAHRAEAGFILEVRDIEADPALEAAFGEIIPVLEYDGVEICRFRLDDAALKRCLHGPDAPETAR